MNELPGHYLGSIPVYAADRPWNLEYSIALDAHGHYHLYSRDTEGAVRVIHAGSSGRALASFAVRSGFDVEELLRDLDALDVGFAEDFRAFLERRAQ